MGLPGAPGLDGEKVILVRFFIDFVLLIALLQVTQHHQNPNNTSCIFRDPEGSLESLALLVQLVLKAPEGRVESWVSQDPREIGETWVHLDHL